MFGSIFNCTIFCIYILPLEITPALNTFFSDRIEKNEDLCQATGNGNTFIVEKLRVKGGRFLNPSAEVNFEWAVAFLKKI